MPLNKRTTYHTPPRVKILCPNIHISKCDQRDEAVILSHICWGPGAPPPPSGWPPNPPDPPPP